MDKFQAGTVIHGTGRTEDLIPAFIAELKRQGSHHAERLRIEWENFDHDTDDEVEFCFELMDYLHDLAPEGYCFGAHPENGSDYGYWETGLSEQS